MLTDIYNEAKILKYNGLFQQESICGMIKLTVRKHIAWATFWNVNLDHRTDVCKCGKKKIGPRVTPPFLASREKEWAKGGGGLTFHLGVYSEPP